VHQCLLTACLPPSASLPQISAMHCLVLRKNSVVNNTFQKYSQYQYIYFMKHVLAIPIPINESKSIPILLPILSSNTLWLKPVTVYKALRHSVKQTSIRSISTSVSTWIVISHYNITHSYDDSFSFTIFQLYAKTTSSQNVH